MILSAQCTDERVNKVTPTFFRAYPNVEALAKARRPHVEALIKSCGFYHVKAKSLVTAACAIMRRFGGRVPRSMEELLTLPGVGRKTANVMLAVAFKRAAMPVDTHVFRVANRLKLARGKTARDVELALMKNIPQRQWSPAHHWLIQHGRRVCHARNPECARCFLLDLCPSAKRFMRQNAARGKSAGSRAHAR